MSKDENAANGSPHPFDLDAFDELARTRRSVRKFLSTPIPEGLLERLIDTARWAPSGYNLQPTHIVVVDDPELKLALCEACLGQSQVKHAPVTLVFTGDRNVANNNLDQIIAQEKEIGALDDKYEHLLRKYVALGFSHGPLGLGWLVKATVYPLLGKFTGMPEIPAVHKRFWLAKQVMLSSMVFMLAAHAAGLATVPMEGFIERKIRKLLGIPRSHIIPLVLPVGYPAPARLKKSRLPVEAIVHRNGW